uniref:Fatty acid binding protein 2 n=1 Tax=Canis lupus familiaris TaxID=9615 RepID=A0A8I3S7G9_CANLF
MALQVRLKTLKSYAINEIQIGVGGQKKSTWRHKRSMPGLIWAKTNIVSIFNTDLRFEYDLGLPKLDCKHKRSLRPVISLDLWQNKGINVVKRKLATHDNLKLTITQEGNKFTVKESSTFRTIEIVFELGVTFNYSLADGTELTGTWNLEGNKLVGKFKRVDNGNELNAIREIIGGELVQTYTYEGVEAKRIFKKE